MTPYSISTHHNSHPLTSPCFSFEHTNELFKWLFGISPSQFSPVLTKLFWKSQMQSISFLVVVWSVVLCVRVLVCALPGFKIDRFPPHPCTLNGAERWSLFLNLVITMLTYGVLEKIPKSAPKTADFNVIHSSCDCHYKWSQKLTGLRTQ